MHTTPATSAPGPATSTPGTATSTPGTATSRYLAAMRNRGPLSIDWAAAPTRHKRYPGAGRVRLPWTADRHHALGLLGELLRDLLGMTRIVWSHHLDDGGEPSGRPPMLLTGRPAPSGGGLYPIEAYVAAGDALSPAGDAALFPAGESLSPIGEPHLPAGLYHYDPVHHVLERLRDGDHVPALTGLLADGPPADLVIVLSAVFWRSMFKYGDFGYRLICQETGVLIAQALAVGGRLSLATRAHLRFPDGEMDRLLGLDGTREATLAVLTFTLPPTTAPTLSRSGESRSQPAFPSGEPRSQSTFPSGAPPTRPADAPPLMERLMSRPVAGESRPLPRPMPDGPAAALHRASTRAQPGRAGSGSSDRAFPPRPPVRAGRSIPAPEPATGHHPAEATAHPEPSPAGRHAAEAAARRASPPAGYRPVPLPAEALGAVLVAAGGGYPADLPGTATGPAATALCLLSLRVAGLPNGAYWYDPARHTLHELPGTTQVEAGPLLANTRVALRGAAAVLIPVGDPVAGAGTFGDRWYRMQQMEAGLIAQRATLAATALGLAARIHSDGANETTDEALGLAGTPLRSLSFLAMGTPPTGGPLVTRPIPALVNEEVMPPRQER
ncbi:nitroreductase family protein [Nonomuraea rubra]|uniref:nitroreductase family protein n=1 Tax=Nonomuraea rubra TaxID=46180 RepID=UPI0034081B84